MHYAGADMQTYFILSLPLPRMGEAIGLKELKLLEAIYILQPRFVELYIYRREPLYKVWAAHALV